MNDCLFARSFSPQVSPTRHRYLRDTSYISAFRRGGLANQWNKIISLHHTTKHEIKVHMWLSRVKIPHRLSSFFRDKAIQSEMISTLLTNSHWVRWEKKVHNFSHKTETRKFQRQKNPKRINKKKSRKEQNWTTQRWNIHKQSLTKSNGWSYFGKFNPASHQ